MSAILYRPMEETDRAAVAELVHLSTNAWYAARGLGTIFPGEPASCAVFGDVYAALDPGCGIVAVSVSTQTVVGSCFYHPRPTHISVGIVNVHPSYFGHGVARTMLAEVLARADRENKPVRLVSSALNLDSYSLYTRSGFVPRQLFQDMVFPSTAARPPVPSHVRPAVLGDLPKIVALERELLGIERGDDYRYFIESGDGLWRVFVAEGEGGALDGCLVSVQHPASNMLGPGVMRDELTAAALVAAQLSRSETWSPVMVVPVEAATLVQTLYGWGARNCELHVLQVRGAYTPPRGLWLPTFLPETG